MNGLIWAIVGGLIPIVYAACGVFTFLADSFYHTTKFREAPPIIRLRTIKIVVFWPWYASAAFRRLIAGFEAEIERRERLRN